MWETFTVSHFNEQSPRLLSVTAQDSSNTGFEHSTTAASGCAPSVDVLPIFDVKQQSGGTPLGMGGPPALVDCTLTRRGLSNTGPSKNCSLNASKSVLLYCDSCHVFFPKGVGKRSSKRETFVDAFSHFQNCVFESFGNF
ncbi:hypothetical protein WN51_13306 [Melipona quadrifasciata]|uniref:Uncharacterized protein n=1 Tax=Melipona quadrifasciata TaxID=166423 RepID=A0A0M9A173_9HYME|nr:hypothetical protein WN51_13306 [Melipona quadrifasciata]